MPNERLSFDPITLMYKEEPREVKMATLSFHRWKAEREGRTYSQPQGDFLFKLPTKEIVRRVILEREEAKIRKQGE